MLEEREPSGGQVFRGVRLHPSSPIFEILRSFMSFVVPGLILLLLAAEDSYEVWYMLAFVPAVGTSFVRYLTRRYELTPDHIVIRSGLFFRTIRKIPLDRIQNIDTLQNPLHRFFGVAEVRLETAGGQEPEAVLRVLPMERLRQIQHAATAAHTGMVAGNSVSEGAQAVASSPAASPFFRMSAEELTLYGLLSQKGVAILAGMIFVWMEFDLGEKVLGMLPFDPMEWSRALTFWSWALGAVLLLFLLQLLTVAWAFITLYDFRIVRSGNALATTCGLWTRQSATLPRHRIQCLSVREGLLARLLGRMAIRAVSAGGDSTEDNHVSRKWLIPLARRTDLTDILCEVQPELDLEGARWQGVHPRAFRRLFVRWLLIAFIPVTLLAWQAAWWLPLFLLVWIPGGYWAMSKRARRLSYALTDHAVLLRDGVFTEVCNVIRYSKIQSVSLSQTPLDRLHHMATVTVDTAGAQSESLRLGVPFMPLGTARRVLKRLAERAGQSSFRW